MERNGQSIDFQMNKCRKARESGGNKMNLPLSITTSKSKKLTRICFM